jgi:ABC-2 type transport system permease protein
MYSCIIFVVGLIAFWSVQTTAVDSFYYSLRNFLRGDNIPLWILATYFGSWVSFTPFAFFIHHPFQIYLGKYSATEIVYTFVGGIGWCIILWLLARIVFKMGLKRNEAVGL